MRKLLVAVLFLAVGTPAWAQKVERIEIVEYGIYTADKLKSQRDPNGQLHSTIGNLHTTRRPQLPYRRNWESSSALSTG